MFYLNSIMKVAIVHYWLISMRGGEKVVKSILKLYPEADVYTLFYDKNNLERYFEKHAVYSSILDNRLFRNHYQKLFPLYPCGIKSLKLRHNYDLIISSESGPAKGISIEGNASHICYTHTPMRYCWGFTDEYLKVLPRVLRPVAKFSFKKLRNWDLTTIDNVDYYIANSNNVKKRIKMYYQKDSKIIYPPIDLSLFDDGFTVKSVKKRNYYLSFGALVPYKNITLLVDTFNQSGKKLVIIGDGSERKKLEKKANNNISFTGSLPWEKIKPHIIGAKALLFPGEDDFGMIPLEVMAYGLPVIALGKGGALETVIENKIKRHKSSGVFFHKQSIKSLVSAINEFEDVIDKFDSSWIINHARKFGEDIFMDKFSKEVERIMKL